LPPATKKLKFILILLFCKDATEISGCVTGGGAGVDNVWEQEKLEARNLLACIVPHRSCRENRRHAGARWQAHVADRPGKNA